VADSNFGKVGNSQFKILPSDALRVCNPPNFCERWRTWFALVSARPISELTLGASKHLLRDYRSKTVGPYELYSHAITLLSVFKSAEIVVSSLEKGSAQ
jgi:hypothetical protein